MFDAERFILITNALANCPADQGQWLRQEAEQIRQRLFPRNREHAPLNRRQIMERQLGKAGIRGSAP